MTHAVVIGAGPAGLMAAEQLGFAGLSVLVAEAKPSVGRKFLMAGKSGLNLTKSEPLAKFISYYDIKCKNFDKIISKFDNHAAVTWAKSLDQEMFVGSSGRVFPKVMKASPLLRSWLVRLQDLQVDIRTRWRWTGWSEGQICFETPEGPKTIDPKVVVLAMGGGSWARLGSDGAWVPYLRHKSVRVTPFQASNIGVHVDWSVHMAPQFGKPVKAITLRSGDRISRGEIILSKTGIEGSGIYTLAPQLRAGAGLTIDLLPDWTIDKINQRWVGGTSKQSLGNRLRKSLRLGAEKIALIMEFARPLPSKPGALLKALPIPITGLRPIDEAISTAGGVAMDQVDETLMLKALPGVFCAGEMLDWDAPTGGYLLTACLATGRWAGQHAAAYARRFRG